MKTNEEKIARIKAYFETRGDVAFAFLFGSGAKGTMHVESDVDIGVYFTPSSRFLEYESETRYPGEQEIWSELDSMLGRRVDMVVLNRAPATLFDAVLREGIEIFSKEGEPSSRLVLAVSDLAEDFRIFVSDFVKIKERSTSLSPDDRTRLLRIVDFLQDRLPEFQTFGAVDQRQYERDMVVKRNMERWAETVANASIDAAKIVLASAKRPLPQTYKSILKELAFLPDFDEKTAAALSDFGDLRNILAHEYLDLRFFVLQKFSKEGGPSYSYLIEYAKKILAENEKISRDT